MMSTIEHLNQTAAKDHAQPEEILAALDIGCGENILEIGAGGGWYAERFAQAVGEGGHYYGIDVRPEFVNHLRHLGTRYPQISAELVSAGGLPATALRFDRIFSRNVCHHLRRRVTYFAALRDMLKENGELIVIDFNQPHGTHRQPHHYTEEAALCAEMQQAGLVLRRRYDFLYRQLFLVFGRSETGA